VKHRWPAVATALTVLVSPVLMNAADPPDPGVTLIGVGSVPGSALDLSGLQDSQICAIDVDQNPTTNCINGALLDFQNVYVPEKIEARAVSCAKAGSTDIGCESGPITS